MNNKFIKYPIILLIVCACCAAALAATYGYTQPVLEKREAVSTQNNLKKLYSNVDSFKVIYNKQDLADESLLEVYEIKLKDNSKAIVYKTSNKGKNGDIISLISFKNNKVDKIKNIIHAETPGIGARIDEDDYLNKITKQPINSMKVETISGATYSSTALKKSVEAAIKHFTKEGLK